MKFIVKVMLFGLCILIAISFLNGTLSASTTNPSLEQASHKGKVLETMNAGSYTYILFQEKGKKLWAAAPRTLVKIGDTVAFGQAAPMKNFFSKTLNRKFETILFVGAVTVNGNTQGSPTAVTPGSMKLPKGHAPIGQMAKKQNIVNTVTVKPGEIKKADGGYTVEQCYEGKTTLKGKKITIKGKVVKFTPKIMGKNWLHIQDGTGKQGTNDLTVTTQDKLKVGDIVLVKGTIVYDKDFGYGYRYKVIVEDAKVIVE
jgi:hypothetical protein